MGRLGNAGTAPSTSHSTPPHHPPGNDTRLSHFSHPHTLELTSLDLEQSPTPPICAGCNSRASGSAYCCQPCNYVLDVSCAKMPRRIRHPAHPHSMNLHAMVPFEEGPSNCEACGRSSTGFMFRCDPCGGYELHCQCAAKPLSVNRRAHCHPLNLVFSPPYEDKGFSCDICEGVGSNHWLYRCAGCEFDAHIGCATAATTQARPRPTTPQQQAPQRPPVTQQPRPPARQQQAPRIRPPMPQQQALQRPLTPQQQAPWRPPSRQQQAPPRPLLAPGLLHPPRPLQPRPPRPQQMNQVTQGSNNGAEQQNGEGTKTPGSDNGVEQQNDEDTKPNTTEGGDGDGGGSGNWSQDGGEDGSHWMLSQDGVDDASNWMLSQGGEGDHGSNWMPNEDGGEDGSNSVPEGSFAGSEESYEVNMEVTYDL